MAELYATNLLEAIKTDNAETFGRIINDNHECLSFCYGRFPVLSLCYLYNSKKIIKAFSSPLKGITRYTFLEEDLPTYRKFREISKKALKLYVYGGKVVSPLDMLAILDEQLLLEAEFPSYHNSLAESQNIKTVYSILHKREATIDGDRIKIKKRKMPSTLQFLVVILIVCFASAAITFSGIASNSVSTYFGKGTSASPMKIMNGEQMTVSLKKGNLNYTLEKDITFSDIPDQFNLSGELDGKGHTIYFKCNSDIAVFGELSGTLKNINFVFENLNLTLKQNIALLTLKNDGRLENINIKANGTFTKSPALAAIAYFLSCGVGENYGSIRDVTLDADIVYNSSGNGDAYLAGIASVNYATITDCSTTATSRFIGNTVDVAALVTENGKDGTISGCTNNAYVFQESNKTTWSPNVGGIALNNFGTIQNSSNYGKLEISFDAQSDSNSFIGGIVINNNGKVNSCQNFAEIAFSVKTQTTNVSYLGGIVAVNNGNINACQNSGKIVANVVGSSLKTATSVLYTAGIAATNNAIAASIDNSSNAGNLSLHATGNSTFFGAGIIAKNFGTTTNCRNSAEIVATYDDSFETSVCLGGICAQNLNRLTKNKNSGNITASTKAESTTVFSLLVGGIVGHNINNGTILAVVDNCINVAKIKLTSTASSSDVTPYVLSGGIVGANFGAIFSCISDTTFVLNCQAAVTPKLFVGEITAFIHKEMANSDYINNNYFAGQTPFGIASIFTYVENNIANKSTMEFGDPSNIGCTKKERNQLKDLKEYWE